MGGTFRGEPAGIHKENQEPLEDIGYNEKSETRLLIEKFVEEKPEHGCIVTAQLAQRGVGVIWQKRGIYRTQKPQFF